MGDQHVGRDLDEAHRRPPGVGDEVVEALGLFSEALERIHRARGHLYAFHQLTGGADAALDRVAELLRGAGHEELAGRIERELIGLNVLEGRWTFQVVEEYDAGYYATFQRLEAEARDQLVGGRTHVYEAEMKARRRSPGVRGHERGPGAAG
ncbi:hypothetical protein OUY22_34245 [Nonomuraea sp. MCN248]|uniref:Uncharacterized protein n=1 Tax=Nonomuraea corallina TaxID=2989783 RepID=A0ABT4SNI0_9ACTN|nr:hypothetical protein [Nonomuraea corallina]MDA0638495.1 hypothetical protein [Nonomuraea corallina]